MKNQGFKKGVWSQEEDSLLRRCIEIHGEGKWYLVSKRAGLNRCRKSCRLRWLNYLKPNVNQEKLMEDEIDLVIRMHKLLGNKWSLIAGRIPGRTANGIKNYWNTYLKKTVESQAKEEEPERHRVVRPIPRYPTTVIGKGASLIVSENQNHQFHHGPPQPPPLPLPEQNEDPVIQNNEPPIWWNNDTFKFLEDLEYLNGNPAFSNIGESSGTGMEGKETTMLQDSTIDSTFDWGDIFNLNF